MIRKVDFQNNCLSDAHTKLDMKRAVLQKACCLVTEDNEMYSFQGSRDMIRNSDFLYFLMGVHSQFSAYSIIGMHSREM